ncbi:MAG TPA: T9SS type B sorting domain-containing protein [Chitinophagaceae bacterium]|nr:T9SS type B sorting domain-containing protein [Chitinophagaceae bacterium]
MTSVEGEDVVAPNWFRYSPNFPTQNSPDVNDANGPLNCTSGLNWAGGLPTSSPDGGTWQNVYREEDFSQTISSLTIGATYYFRYYYSSQGIAGSPQPVYTTPYPPSITIIGASGYINPPAGVLFEWETYSATLVATGNSITIIISQGAGVEGYLAYDGFYLSPAAPGEKGLYVPTAFTPNADGKNDNFKPSIFGNVLQYQFAVYSRWGEIVFSTNKIDEGWNGSFNGHRQDANIFVWYCIYQLEGEDVKRKKGTVALIR